MKLKGGDKLGSYEITTNTGKYIDKAFSLAGSKKKAKSYLKNKRVGTTVMIDKNLGWITKGKTKMIETIHDR